MEEIKLDIPKETPRTNMKDNEVGDRLLENKDNKKSQIIEIREPSPVTLPLSPQQIKLEMQNKFYRKGKIYFIPAYCSLVIKALKNINMPNRTLECLFTLIIKIKLDAELPQIIKEDI